MKQMTPIIKEIGDNRFYIRPFPAFTAANMTGDLANMATPMLAAIAPIAVNALNSKKEGKKVLDTDVAEMAPSLQGAFSGLSGDKLERLCRKLLVEHQNISVEMPGEEKSKLLTADLANEVFCGDTQDMFVLMWHVIQVNFAGFFKKLAAQFGLDGDLLKKLQNTQNMAPLT